MKWDNFMPDVPGEFHARVETTLSTLEKQSKQINIIKKERVKIMKFKTILATGMATCFVFVFSFIITNNFIAEDAPINQGTQGNAVSTTPGTPASNDNPPDTDGDIIAFNNASSIGGLRKAWTYEEVTNAHWLEKFSFIPLEIGGFNSVVCYFNFSKNNPEDFVGGSVQFTDGLEEPEQFLLINISQKTADSPSLEDVSSASCVAFPGDELKTSLIGQTKAILYQHLDESGIWGTHSYGVFDLYGYRIEFEGRNLTENMVIELIKT
jgi:hypothetical protein